MEDGDHAVVDDLKCGHLKIGIGRFTRPYTWNLVFESLSGQKNESN